MFDLNGRTALIAGASSGLGQGFARLLASAGARVALGARRLGRVEALAAEIVASGGEAVGVALDVTDGVGVITAFDTIETLFGTIDTVVCNAGVGHGGRSTDASIDDIRSVFDTNLLGSYLVAREAAKRMIAAGSQERENGRIVMIGSITAEQHHTGDAAYAATKAGIAHLARNFAKEWARQGINVNTIQPGWVLTEINREWYDSETSDAEISALPRRRMLEQTALDDMLLYLCSDRSRQVTGATFTIDDGQSL